jgi:hypothetical protein
MARYSKQLARLAKADERIDSYEYDPGNDSGAHWLHLRWPWTTDDGGSVHEYTVADCLSELRYAYREKEKQG